MLVSNLLINKQQQIELYDFTAKTNPKKSAVEQFLMWTSNQIDMQFSMAGYVVPLSVIDGETWSTEQDYYLELVTALGTAAMTSDVLKPAPAIGAGRGESSGNLFRDLFKQELAKIYNPLNSFETKSTIRFRAKTYSGSPAEYSVREPIGPQLDYIAGLMNPEDHFSLQALTDLRLAMQNYVEINFPNWGDFYGLYTTRLNGYNYAS